jgi:hypothetical protein
MVRVRINRHPCPHHRELAGDPLGARALHERDEVLKQQLIGLELEPKLAASPQVILKRLMQRGHAAPPSGQGRAILRSAARSTFAYRAVVRMSRCLSTCPISLSDAPARSISVAAVCRKR